MAAARGDQAGRRQELAAGEDVAPRRRIVLIGWLAVAPFVPRLQPAKLGVAQDASPKLNPLSDRKRVGMNRAVVRGGQDVESAENDLGSALAIPACEGKGPSSERQVNRDPHDLRERVHRRRSLEEVLVPVRGGPIGGC